MSNLTAWAKIFLWMASAKASGTPTFIPYPLSFFSLAKLSLYDKMPVANGLCNKQVYAARSVFGPAFGPGVDVAHAISKGSVCCEPVSPPAPFQ